ncbi:class I SAM-dependent methyltransferase [Nevskia ramosa]|uniref:class I SAM-dependent methyltransferase n=1 Tax=Nevskia ramosa TaxID=64002 RepID=UPI003D1073EB
MPITDSGALRGISRVAPHSMPMAGDRLLQHRPQAFLDALYQSARAPLWRLRRTESSLSAESGRLLRQMVDVSAARLVVALGSADGVAAVWLADALREAAGGRGDRALIAFERDADAAQRARAALRGAGISRYVDIRCDNPTRLLGELDTPIDLVLLLDTFDTEATALLPQLTAKLRPGGILIVPQIQRRRRALAGWLATVRAPDGPYRSLSLPIDGGLEWSVKQA